MNGNMIQPDNFQEYVTILNLKLLREEFDEAKEILSQLERIDETVISNFFLIQVIKILISIETDSIQEGLDSIDQFIKRLNQEKDKMLLVYALIVKAKALLKLTQLDEGLLIIDEGIQILKLMSDTAESKLREGTFEYIRAQILRRKGEYNKALPYFRNSLSIREKWGHILEIAESLNGIGTCYVQQGENDLALGYFNRSLEIYKNKNCVSLQAKVFNNLGNVFWQKQEYSLALENFNKSLQSYQKLGNKRYAATLLHNIGLIYRSCGDLTSSLEHFNLALQIFEELGNSYEISICMTNIGVIHKTQGNLKEALEVFTESLELSESREDKLEISTCFNNLGNVYQMLGEFQTSLEYYRKGLELADQIGNSLHISRILYNMILLLFEIGMISEAKRFSNRLERIHQISHSRFIDQYYYLIKGMLLKRSSRIIHKAEAQQLFQKISKGEINDIDVSLNAILNLCESLIEEFRISKDIEVLNDLKSALQEGYEISRRERTFVWLAQMYWLQSKLALIEYDLERAQIMINQAELIANERQFEKLATTIAIERDIMLTQFSTLTDISYDKPPISEMLRLTQIEDLIGKMIYRKLYRSQEEVQEYAKKASELVEEWEKEDWT